MDIKKLRDEFRSPGQRYRMAPLFRVNDEIDSDEMKWQIASLREQGCGGIFAICEVFDDGAPDKFLSEWWWNVVRDLAQACAREEMDFWVYDDEDWPSGSIGGQLMEGHPERNWKYLKSTERVLQGPGEVEEELDESSLVAVTAFRMDGRKVIEDSLQDLTGTVHGGLLRWQVPEGSWTLAAYSAHPGKGFFIDTYGDLMDREAMKAFVDQVYQGHLDRIQDIQSLKFVGYFTDEPAMSLSMIEWGERFDWYPAMPYTPELPEAFEQRYGFSWRKNLPLLYHDGGPASFRFRCRHWETCCFLYSENYFGQIYRFCEERGLLSSGHLVVEENFANHLAQQGGNLQAHYRYMHIPGIDWIHPFEQHLPATTPKYATSIAHLDGRERTWCETFAASGWGLTFQEMRHIVNWEHINGINMQIPICCKYSLRGPKRTRFFNPGIGYQQPYWDHFRGFADYEARLCVLASGGGHSAQLALVYPTVDLWGHCWEPALLKQRSDEFNRMGDQLRLAGYDFDILDDYAISSQSRIESGVLRTSTESFEALILPHVDAARLSTVRKMKDLFHSGGAVCFIGNLPRHSFENGSEDAQIQDAIRDLLGEDCYDRAARKETILVLGQPGKACFIPETEDAAVHLQTLLEPDLRCHEGLKDIVAFHRVIDENHLYLLYNFSKRKQEGVVSLLAQGHPEIWNPETGETHPHEDYTIRPTGTRIRLSFQPDELISVLLHPHPVTRQIRRKEKLLSEVLIQGPFEFSIEETMSRPHIAWNWTQKEDHWTSMAPPLVVPKKIPAGDWCQYGLAHFSGLGIYDCDVDIPLIPGGSRVELDLGRVAISAEVKVNGQSAGMAYFEPYRLDITSLAKSGMNHLEIRVANTLSNYFSQFQELAGAPLHSGGDLPERRISGLIGPLKVRVYQSDGA